MRTYRKENCTSLLANTICSYTCHGFHQMCFEIQIARQRLWSSLPINTTERRAKPRQKGIELHNSSHSVIILEVRRMFPRAVKDT